MPLPPSVSFLVESAVRNEPRQQRAECQVDDRREHRMAAGEARRAHVGEVRHDVGPWPLEEVLEHIARTLFIDVVVDDNRLASVGVNSKTQVSLDVDGIVFRSALDLLLTPLELEYRVQDEVLMITSREADERLHTRVYAVPDLETPLRWYVSSGRHAETIELLLRAGAKRPQEIGGSPAVREVLQRL